MDFQRIFIFLHQFSVTLPYGRGDYCTIVPLFKRDKNEVFPVRITKNKIALFKKIFYRHLLTFAHRMLKYDLLELDFLNSWRAEFSLYYSINFRVPSLKSKKVFFPLKHKDFRKQYAYFYKTYRYYLVSSRKLLSRLFRPFKTPRKPTKRTYYFLLNKCIKGGLAIKNNMRRYNRFYYKCFAYLLLPLKRQQVEYMYFTINFISRKNNLFIVFSEKKGDVIHFLSAGRIMKGKKKTSTLAAKHLTKILLRLMQRFFKKLYLYFAKLPEKKKRFMIFYFMVRNFFYTPLLKNVLNVFRLNEFTIHRFIDRVAVPHSYGVKRRKARRV